MRKYYIKLALGGAQKHQSLILRFNNKETLHIDQRYKPRDGGGGGDWLL